MSDSTKKAPTMNDVAKIAGVARSTVSMALSKNPRIAKSTQTRVFEAAAACGYTRNPLVAAWMKHIRTTKSSEYRATLGVLIGTEKPLWYGNPVAQETYKGFQQYAESQGYFISPFFLYSSKERLSRKRLSQILTSRSISGLLLIALSTKASSRRLNINEDDFSLVTIGYTLLQPNVDRICSNNYHSMLLALRTVRKKGYKRIAFLWHRHSENTTDRAYTSAFKTFQGDISKRERIPFEACEVKTNQFSRSFFENWAKVHQPDLVISRPLACNQIYAWNKSKNLGLVTLSRLGCHPEISGINQQNDLSGETAAKMLISKIERNERGVPEHPILHLVEGKWEEGKTTPSML